MNTFMLNLSETILSFRPELMLVGLKIALVLGAAFLATHWLRKVSAGMRYRVWIAAFFCLALIPFMPFSLEFTGPSWATPTAVNAQPEAGTLLPIQRASTPEKKFTNAPIEFAPHASETPKHAQTAKGLPVKASGVAWILFLVTAVYLSVFMWGVMKLCWNLFNAKRQTNQGRKPTLAERDRLATLSGNSAKGDLGKIIVICNQDMMPRAWGFPKPKLLLPESALFWNDSQLRNVLLHEWAHIQRQDFLFGLIVDVVALAYWPLLPVWTARKRLALERERACDEAVLDQGIRPSAYAEQLLKLACGMRGNGPAHAMHFSRGSHLKARISSILKFKSNRTSRFSQACLSIALLTSGLCLAALTPTQQTVQEPDPSSLEAWVASLNSQSEPAPEPKLEPKLMLSKQQNPESQPQTAPEPSLEPKPEPAPRKASVPWQKPSHQPNPSGDPVIDLAHKAILQQDGETIPELIKLLGDMTPWQEQTLQYPRYWEPANKQWIHPSPGETAAIALASLGGMAVQPLIDALRSDNADVRRNAAWSLGEIRGHEDQDLAIQPLIETLQNDSDSEVQVAAAYALGETKSRLAGPALIAALDDMTNSALRQMAAWALGEIRYKQAVLPLVQRLLDEPDWQVRKIAVRALGEIGSSDAMDVLVIALNDDHQDVRSVAKWALSEIGDGDFDFDL